ncbi:hypothetical protein R6Q59_014425 [Mikania micrantha]
MQVQGMPSDASTLKRLVYGMKLHVLLGKKLLQLMSGLEVHETNFGADVFVRPAGGELAGITAASATNPLYIVRTRLSAQTNINYYKGIWHALHTISKEEGVFGLYKGLGACLLGVGPNLAISFSVYDTVRSYWKLQRYCRLKAYVAYTEEFCQNITRLEESSKQEITH